MTTTLPEVSPPVILPPFAVIIENDQFHTFKYVTEVICKVFRYTLEKSTQLTTKIHKEGEAIVWIGPKEIAELKSEQITNAGTDFFAAKPVNFPLKVRIEQTI